MYVNDPSGWLRGALNFWPLSVNLDLRTSNFQNTKLPLLRHTRHITFVSDIFQPPVSVLSSEHPEEDADGMRPEELEMVIQDAILQTGRIDDATDIVVSLTEGESSVFSNLESVQVGQRDWRGEFVMQEWMLQE